MEALLSRSRHIIRIAVYSSLIAAVVAFLWGGYKTLVVLGHVIDSISGSTEYVIGVELIAIMDAFLIATALYIFSIGIYELFIADVKLPKWLEIHSLHDLKSKLSGVIILVMAATFLEHLVRWHDAAGTLMFGAGISLVTATLIAFVHFGGKD